MKIPAWLLCGVALCASSIAAAEEGPAEPSTVEFVTLGTGGGPVIRRDRGQPANALVVGDNIYLFDIGASTNAHFNFASGTRPIHQMREMWRRSTIV